jgi:hypothetical protein
MVVEAETGSDEQAKYKANAHARRRLWAFAKNTERYGHWLPIDIGKPTLNVKII